MATRVFRPYDPSAPLPLPPDLRAWLPPDHTVYLLSDLLDELDLTPILASYAQGDGGGLHFFGGLGFAEEFPQADAQERAGNTKDVEAGAPTVILSQVAGEGAAGDGPGVDAGLVQRHGAGTRIGAVEGADEGHGGGEVEGFAQAFQPPEDDEVRVLRGEGGSDRDQRPGDKAAEDNGFAGEAVADPTGEWAGGGVDPGEGAAHDAELDIGQIHLAAEQGENGEDGLAVRVIEETDEPQHGHQPPFVRGVLHRFVDCRWCNDI